MQKRILTLEEAARLGGVPLEELRTAFKDGLIIAHRFENTGLYHLEEAELDRYLRASRKLDLSHRGALRRILIVEDDLGYAETLRLDLERDWRLEARVSTWGRDAVDLIHGFRPHLSVLGWHTPDLRVALVLDVLGMRWAKRNTRILAYGSNTTRAEWSQDPDQSLQALGVQTLVSKARGLAELVRAVYAALSLEPAASFPG